jgi:hypothetical protein
VSKKYTSFVVDNTTIRFIETLQVKVGVECDTYAFEVDSSKDLAIVRVKMGFKTPLQRVMKGERTVEGFLSGAGTLVVWATDGAAKTYDFKPGDGTDKTGVEVAKGQLMQWSADKDEDLVFYEICEPPYEDGRFEDLPE